ncbi:MAG TPA: glucose-1-phosphate adenylyltransferase [Negativicutes bacterium]|nr:glucose-1-phosphate adenylyltransferase [Negativicutes bacterium]
MHKECVAMILAGGQGSRLGVLTRTVAKPAVPFGAKYRLIDFTLSNCHNSGIDTIGVLTQYQPFELHNYIGIGSPWDLDRNTGGVHILPPFVRARGGEWYQGTANAIHQNATFIDQFTPRYVVILSGDHIYKMDYARMLAFHKLTEADATIAVIEVPWKEASRFGIMSTDQEGRITEFAEKPKEPQSNLASMGVYVFTWKALRKFLEKDDKDRSSSHDFGKDVIPAMLGSGQKMMAYAFEGYWRDVGTVESLWEANMDLLSDRPELDLYDPGWRIYSINPAQPPHFVAAGGKVRRVIASVGCRIFGEVENSVLFPGVHVGPGAVVKDSVVMQDAQIGANAIVEQAIIGQEAVIGDGCQIGMAGEAARQEEITVIGERARIVTERVIPRGTMVD